MNCHFLIQFGRIPYATQVTRDRRRLPAVGRRHAWMLEPARYTTAPPAPPTAATPSRGMPSSPLLSFLPLHRSLSCPRQSIKFIHVLYVDAALFRSLVGWSHWRPRMECHKDSTEENYCTFMQGLTSQQTLIRLIATRFCIYIYIYIYINKQQVRCFLPACNQPDTTKCSKSDRIDIRRPDHFELTHTIMIVNVSFCFSKKIKTS